MISPEKNTDIYFLNNRILYTQSVTNYRYLPIGFGILYTSISYSLFKVFLFF